ncbi:hypothetical protein PPUJ21368_22210 [Pseudomonas putida]|nr:hypothetical protein PPUJ21368_22210 [Pseudomonas putida]
MAGLKKWCDWATGRLMVRRSGYRPRPSVAWIEIEVQVDPDNITIAISCLVAELEIAVELRLFYVAGVTKGFGIAFTVNSQVKGRLVRHTFQKPSKIAHGSAMHGM